MIQWLLLSSLLVLSSAFAEENFEIPTDSQALQILKEALYGKSDHVDKQVARLGNRTVEVQSCIAMPGDIALFRKISPQYSHWRNWLLQDINLPPEGESDYIIQFQDAAETEPGVVTASYKISLPFFSRQRIRAFKMTSNVKDPGYSLLGEAILSENSPVKFTKAYMKVFPAEGMKGHLWVLIKGIVQFRGWFLYEALPEKILLREAGDRLKRIIDNYHREEELFKADKKSPPNPTPVNVSIDEE
jgi:hypothetical protein